MTHRYPLQWPAGWPRTDSWQQTDGGFKVTYSAAVKQLAAELERLGVDSAYISSDQEVRLDGSPRRDRQPRSQAVALYFEREGKQLCIPCDRFDSVRSNVRAVGLTLEAIRRMERYGTSQMIEAALSGFAQLPAVAGPSVGPRPWHEVLGVSPDAPKPVIQAAYRALSKTAHPDSPEGSAVAWDELRLAYEQSGAAA